MKSKLRCALSLGLMGLILGSTVQAQSLLNASYDVAREFYKDYNAAFVAQHK